MDLTDTTFVKLYDSWINQNSTIVEVCEPMGKSNSSDLSFYLQFTNSKDYLNALAYFKTKAVAILQCSVNANRLQVYQYRRSITRNNR